MKNKALKVYGPYYKKDKRQIVIVVEKNNKRRTVSYPKWIMEQHLGRKLHKDKETVDHWDTDIYNNDLSNLRIVPRDVHSADDTRRVKLVKFHCAWCDEEFERSPRLIRHRAKKNNAGPFCSKKCAGKYARMVQLKLIDKLSPQKSIESEYYKRKYIEAEQFIDDDVLIFEDILEFKENEHEYAK